MRLIAILVYFGIGFLNIAALIDGIEIWLDISTFFAVVISLFLAYLPLVGGGLALYAAVDVWGWPWWQAIGIFLILPYGLAAMAAVFDRS